MITMLAKAVSKGSMLAKGAVKASKQAVQGGSNATGKGLQSKADGLSARMVGGGKGGLF